MKKKTIKRIVLGIVLTPIILYGILWLSVSIQSEKRQTLAGEVLMTVNYDLTACTEENPLLIGIKNISNKTVKSTNFDIDIRREGYSNDLSDLWPISYNTDKIIKSGNSFFLCLSYKLKPEYEQFNDPDNLEFEISYKYFQFEK